MTPLPLQKMISLVLFSSRIEILTMLPPRKKCPSLTFIRSIVWYVDLDLLLEMTGIIPPASSTIKIPGSSALPTKMTCQSHRL